MLTGSVKRSDVINERLEPADLHLLAAGASKLVTVSVSKEEYHIPLSQVILLGILELLGYRFASHRGPVSSHILLNTVNYQYHRPHG